MWGIDFGEASLAAASELNLASAINFDLGKGLVGMNHTLWETIAQKLGVKAINLTLPSTGDTLQKCADNGENCTTIPSSVATRISVNTTAGTSVWTIPTTLGFSSYETTSSSSSVSPQSSGPGGTIVLPNTTSTTTTTTTTATTTTTTSTASVPTPKPSAPSAPTPGVVELPVTAIAVVLLRAGMI